MDQILIYATILVPIVTGIMEVIKRSTSTEGKYIPMTALAVGIAIGVAYGVTVGDGNWILYGWSGLLAGMASIGAYELVKKEV